ncbi:MAG: DNA repair protein RadC [Proteobacteria bacterium]|nr:DNA repair protein RadC [Pseudomonadota bacterium]
MTINTLIGANNNIALRQIKAVFEVTAVSEEIANYIQPNTRYTTPSQIFEAFHFLMQETKEYFLTLHLDGKNRINCIDVVSIGSLNQSIVHPREVFKTALLSSAAAIILVHQHPTGDPSPSSEDIAITRRLKEAGDIIGIKILDHCIIGQDSYISFVERGLL